MIEKLENPKSIRWGDDVDSCIQRHKIIVGAISKINEIIDVLNAIVIDTKDGTFIDGSKKAEPVDKFAEQRKWIGKLCKFYDSTWDVPIYDILKDIDGTGTYPHYQTMTNFFTHCEPVSEDLIYKGE